MRLRLLPRPVSATPVEPLQVTTSVLEDGCPLGRFGEVWERHGGSVYTLACSLLVNETTAAQAVRLGMADLARTTDDAPGNDDHRSWSRHVYWRSQELTDAAPAAALKPSATTPLGQLVQPQRTYLALFLFGGHTCREVAGLFDLPPMIVADLLAAGLRDLKRLGTGGMTALA